MFLTAMTAIGLLVLRLLIARPLVRSVEGTKLRALSIGFVVASVLGLLAIPAYVEESTAVDSLRSFFAFGDLVPLWRVTAFGRGYVDMWICFALFCVAGWIAVWLDRPRAPAAIGRRAPRRSSPRSRPPPPWSRSPASPATRRRPRRAC